MRSHPTLTQCRALFVLLVLSSRWLSLHGLCRELSLPRRGRVQSGHAIRMRRWLYKLAGGHHHAGDHPVYLCELIGHDNWRLSLLSHCLVRGYESGDSVPVTAVSPSRPSPHPHSKINHMHLHSRAPIAVLSWLSRPGRSVLPHLIPRGSSPPKYNPFDTLTMLATIPYTI